MSTSHRPRRTVARAVARTSLSTIVPAQLSVPDAVLLALARILGEIAAQASNRPTAPVVTVSEGRTHAI